MGFVESIWCAIKTGFKLFFQPKGELPCEHFAKVTGISSLKAVEIHNPAKRLNTGVLRGLFHEAPGADTAIRCYWNNLKCLTEESEHSGGGRWVTAYIWSAYTLCFAQGRQRVKTFSSWGKAGQCNTMLITNQPDPDKVARRIQGVGRIEFHLSKHVLHMDEFAFRAWREMKINTSFWTLSTSSSAKAQFNSRGAILFGRISCKQQKAVAFLSKHINKRNILLLCYLRAARSQGAVQ